MSKKITVAGIGGVGGYLAGMLADTYDEVSFIARGERKKSLEENGLVILEKDCCGFFDLYLILYERGFFSSAEREFCRY